MLKVGDKVLLEEAWEDDEGHFHDEYVTVAKILPDGRFTIRIGHWKTRSWKQQAIQAWLNRFVWYAKDYEAITRQAIIDEATNERSL